MEHLVTEDEVTCENVSEEVCGQGQNECREVPRQVCSVAKVKRRKVAPKTECKHVARRACGKIGLCPEKERVCHDKVKTVSQYMSFETKPLTLLDLFFVCWARFARFYGRRIKGLVS